MLLSLRSASYIIAALHGVIEVFQNNKYSGRQRYSVWLHEEGGAVLPTATASLIEETLDVCISPMVRMELQHLYEINRISEPPLPVLDTLESLLGLTICHAPFPAIIKETENQNWTRDPFDGIIVAQAALYRGNTHYQR